MSAARDVQAERSLKLAQDAQLDLKEAGDAYHKARLRFTRDALRAGWSWERMGTCMGLTSNGVRQFWNRYRYEADRLDPESVGAD